MVSRVRIIKKYSNRRLYDTQESRYVNLEDLAALIRQGEQIQVQDVATEADLTRAVLLQVLLEDPDGALLFPPGLLHRIIRYGGELPWQRTALRQIGQAFELLDTQAQQVERVMGWPPRSAKESAPPPRSAKESPPPADPPPEPPAEPPAEPSPAGEVDALRARLAALEARLKR